MIDSISIPLTGSYLPHTNLRYNTSIVIAIVSNVIFLNAHNNNKCQPTNRVALHLLRLYIYLSYITNRMCFSSSFPPFFVRFPHFIALARLPITTLLPRNCTLNENCTHKNHNPTTTHKPPTSHHTRDTHEHEY